MSDVVNVSEGDFSEAVLESQKLVLVDFWAPWCGYCSKLSPIFEELAAEYSDRINFVKVNVDDNRTLAQKLGVMSLPTMILFKDGEEVEKVMGFMPKSTIIAKFFSLIE